MSASSLFLLPETFEFFCPFLLLLSSFSMSHFFPAISYLPIAILFPMVPVPLYWYFFSSLITVFLLLLLHGCGLGRYSDYIKSEHSQML